MNAQGQIHQKYPGMGQTPAYGKNDLQNATLFFILSSMAYFPIASYHQSVIKDFVIFVEFCSESIYYKTVKVLNLVIMLSWAAKK